MNKTFKFMLIMALMLTIALTTQCTAPQDTKQALTAPTEQQAPLLPEPTPPARTASADIKTEKEMPATCLNSFRDGQETDADCGGPCNPCGYGKQCMVTADCAQDLSCDYRSKRCLQRKY